MDFNKQEWYLKYEYVPVSVIIEEIEAAKKRFQKRDRSTFEGIYNANFDFETINDLENMLKRTNSKTKYISKGCIEYLERKYNITIDREDLNNFLHKEEII